MISDAFTLRYWLSDPCRQAPRCRLPMRWQRLADLPISIIVIVAVPQHARPASDIRKVCTTRRVIEEVTRTVSWSRRLITQLTDSRNANGGWGYRPRTSTCAEPTALACLALAAHNAAPTIRGVGLAELTRLQQADGSVAVARSVAEPAWPTALAALAWQGMPALGGDAFRDVRGRAIDWLMHTSGKPLPPRPDILGHDTTIQGWSWTADTHSWVEPTAYAITALRAAGLSDHLRVREGVRLLLDRALPDGGWNYGNTRVYDALLQPFPATTGIALTALAGEPPDKRIKRSLTYLREALAGIHAPLTLAWGMIGLAAWNVAPPDLSQRLAESADRMSAQPDNVMYMALLLLADDPAPLFSTQPATIHD